MNNANRPEDEEVQLLETAPEDVRFLASIADIVRDLIEIEQNLAVLEHIGRDEPATYMAYRLTFPPPCDLN